MHFGKGNKLCRSSSPGKGKDTIRLDKCVVLHNAFVNERLG